jgi:hypothetical protein
VLAFFGSPVVATKIWPKKKEGRDGRGVGQGRRAGATSRGGEQGRRLSELESNGNTSICFKFKYRFVLIVEILAAVYVTVHP